MILKESLDEAFRLIDRDYVHAKNDDFFLLLIFVFDHRLKLQIRVLGALSIVSPSRRPPKRRESARATSRGRLFAARARSSSNAARFETSAIARRIIFGDEHSPRMYLRRMRMCVLSTRTSCKGVATPRRESRAGRRACATARVRAFFLFPSKIDGKAAGRRDRTVLIYKRRGMTLPIIKLAVLLSPRDREPCGEPRDR